MNERLKVLVAAIEAYGQAERALGQAMATPGAKEMDLMTAVSEKYEQLLQSVADWRVAS